MMLRIIRTHVLILSLLLTTVNRVLGLSQAWRVGFPLRGQFVQTLSGDSKSFGRLSYGQQVRAIHILDEFCLNIILVLLKTDCPLPMSVIILLKYCTHRWFYLIFPHYDKHLPVPDASALFFISLVVCFCLFSGKFRFNFTLEFF